MVKQLMFLWNISKKRSEQKYTENGYNQPYKADGIGMVLQGGQETKLSYRNIVLYYVGSLKESLLSKVEYRDNRSCQFELLYSKNGTCHCLYRKPRKSSEQIVEGESEQCRTFTAKYEDTVIDAEYNKSGFNEGFICGTVGNCYYKGTIRSVGGRWFKLEGTEYGVTVNDPSADYDYDEIQAMAIVEDMRYEEQQDSAYQEQEYEAYQHELQRSGRYIIKEDFVYKDGIVVERKNRRYEPK